MFRGDDTTIGKTQFRFRAVRFPGPGVAEPELRQEVNGGFFRAAIMDSHAHKNVVRRGLRIFDEYIPISVIVEYSSVEQLKLRQAGVTFPPCVFCDKR